MNFIDKLILEVSEIFGYTETQSKLMLKTITAYAVVIVCFAAVIYIENHIS